MWSKITSFLFLVVLICTSGFSFFFIFPTLGLVFQNNLRNTVMIGMIDR